MSRELRVCSVKVNCALVMFVCLMTIVKMSIIQGLCTVPKLTPDQHKKISRCKNVKGGLSPTSDKSDENTSVQSDRDR